MFFVGGGAGGAGELGVPVVYIPEGNFLRGRITGDRGWGRRSQNSNQRNEDLIKQQSLTFLAPGTCSLEDNFPTVWGGSGVGGGEGGGAQVVMRGVLGSFW